MNRPYVSRKDYPIPERLNIVILIVSTSATVTLLYLANIQESFWGTLLFAFIFSFINNTNFSLLHEATHGNLHSNRKINRWLGVYVAAFFPTTFTMQQLFHLGHHRRNRTDAEMFDLYYPGDNLLMKKIVIWGTVLGVYWTTPFIACCLFFLSPKLVMSRHFKDSKAISNIKATPMLDGLERGLGKVSLIRLEFLITLAVQGSLFYFLGLKFSTWIMCYWLFGMNWGSLQYADHVNSKRNIREGAWNLKVNPLVRWIFLNYHIHLVHHRYPNVPWIHLPKLKDPNEEEPTYTQKVYEFISGPIPAREGSPIPDESLNKIIYEDLA